MASLEDHKLDADEIRSLISMSRRTRVKEVLQRELLNVEQEMALIKHDEMSHQAHREIKAEQPETTGEPKKLKPCSYTTSITSYAWDQSDKFVKVYITLPGVEKLSKEKIASKFTGNSMDVKVYDLDGKNYQLKIIRLFHGIVSEESYVKVKSGSLLVMMKKEKEKEKWEDVCKKVTAKSSRDFASGFDDKAKDPQESIMELMKKMYDEGDDEMKRTLNKAWTESREKATMDI
ncbi:calcyclin-binding protein-like [Actinia tenebrosa]|uniref:Calcyclin-binding protein n=1 Tax=Actinia tenebrosa TaxID=6105 RepID=A0A6P8I7D9_ACTTE|nr:calcyclin-binding protein-like [Actinia tenebrosa]